MNFIATTVECRQKIRFVTEFVSIQCKQEQMQKRSQKINELTKLRQKTVTNQIRKTGNINKI